MLTRLLVVTGLLFSALAHSASFDCARASTKIESMICADPAVSDLDAQLAVRYEKALNESSNQRALREQQRKWVRDVRNRCADTDCLRTAYSRRAAEFNWITKQAKDSALCEEFRGHKNQRAGLTGYALEEKESNRPEANWVIPNVDVDGDKISDQLLLFRTGSASRIAPDDSSFTLVLSSSGKKFTLEAERFYVVAYKSRYYLLTADWLGEDGPLETGIHRLDRNGINMICSFHCRLPDGSCGAR